MASNRSKSPAKAKTRPALTFDMGSQVLNAVEISQGQFVTITSQSSTTLTESQFAFWGLMDFKQLPGFGRLLRSNEARKTEGRLLLGYIDGRIRHQIAKSIFTLRRAAVREINLRERKFRQRRILGISLFRHILEALFGLGELSLVRFDGTDVVFGNFPLIRAGILRQDFAERL